MEEDEDEAEVTREDATTAALNEAALERVLVVADHEVAQGTGRGGQAVANHVIIVV